MLIFKKTKSTYNKHLKKSVLIISQQEGSQNNKAANNNNNAKNVNLMKRRAYFTMKKFQ